MDFQQDAKIEAAIAQHMATGQYASAEEVVLFALQRLSDDEAEERDTLESLQRSLADVDAGRVSSATTVVEELRKEYGSRAAE